jgi:hypothetical protein
VENQLADYHQRTGRPVEHEAYMTELGRLRDQLRAALSEPPPEGQPSVNELAKESEGPAGDTGGRGSSAAHGPQGIRRGANDGEDEAEGREQPGMIFEAAGWGR